MQLILHLSIGSCVVLPAQKQLFPSEVVKGQKKSAGQETKGEQLKKGLTKLRRDICATISGVLSICQSFSLNADIDRWMQDYELIPAHLSHLPLISTLVKSEISADALKRVKEDIASSILHVETVFGPVLKTLSALDL